MTADDTEQIDVLDDAQPPLDPKKVSVEDATTKVVTVYCHACCRTIQVRVSKQEIVTECPAMQYGCKSCESPFIVVTDGSRRWPKPE